MKLTLNKIIQLKDYKTKGLLINPEEASYRKVNGSGLLISKFIQENPHVNYEEIIEKVSKYYNIPVHLIEKDVEVFINDLVEKRYFLIDEKTAELQQEENESGCTANGIWIKLTNRCNLRCKYCYASSGEGEDDEITLKEILEILETLKEKDYKRIILTGGETLLRKDIIDIVKKCSEYGQVQLLTNGTLGDKALYEELLEYVTTLQISIDSDEAVYHEQNRGKDTFERILKTVEYIKEINPDKLSIAMTPTPDYKGDLKRMIKFCIDNHINSLHINRFVPYGRAKSSYKNSFNMKDFYTWVDEGYNYIYEYYQETLKKNIPFKFDLDVAGDLRMSVYMKGQKRSCGLNKNHLSIDSNGDVYLCPSLHKEELKMGNIRVSAIDEIITAGQENFGDFCVDELHSCKKCEVKYFCGGGCRAVALNDNNDLYGKENSCDIYKDRIYDLMAR